MSMVLSDRSFNSMTIEDWNAAVDPKVKGTWNLHHESVSAAADLDFFVLFSSISGIIGQPGQGNYASANTFLDAFAQYRMTLGSCLHHRYWRCRRCWLPDGAPHSETHPCGFHRHRF